MKTSANRLAFTIIELLVVMVVLAAGLTLLLPALSQEREQSKGLQCANNMKQLGLALLNYEDKRRCLPPISTNLDSVPDVPGDAAPGLEIRPEDAGKVATGVPTIQGRAENAAAGYSWQVFLLPEIEEVEMYQMIVARSKKFQLPAFSAELVEGYPRKTSFHLATIEIRDFKCPAFSSESVLDNSPRVTGAATTVETGTLPPNYQAGVATANGAKGIAITNYNAILGTHIEPDKKSASVPNNGGMVFRGTNFDMGRKLAAMNDGTSKIPLVAETRERRFASWYDGTMNWVVGARHSNPSAGTTVVTPATAVPNKRDPKLPPSWMVGTDGTANTGGAALNYGPTEKTPTVVYLPSGALTDPDISSAAPGRLWGPSSQHPGGVVFHSFADGHVTGIADTIDPNLYLAIISRNGGEMTP